MESSFIERRKIYDPIQRALHAAIGLSIVLLTMTAWATKLFEPGYERASLWALHSGIGYALGALLFMRVLWGFVGPHHARFGSKTSERLRLSIELPHSFGHAPLVGLIYLGVYSLIGLMTATGLALTAIEHGEGPLAPWLFDRFEFSNWAETPHEWGAYLILGFTAMHIGAIIWHEGKDGVPIAQSMVSGYQYRKRQSPENRSGDL